MTEPIFRGDKSKSIIRQDSHNKNVALLSNFLKHVSEKLRKSLFLSRKNNFNFERILLHSWTTLLNAAANVQQTLFLVNFRQIRKFYLNLKKCPNITSEDK